ncbi:helix-turn-helix domain-containing protein [Hymenobacter sp. BT18]|uniref:helix-turn-helix domain-containing protein n=1 Tax=Hymenobacter sp. BT18 TaxID=2835648 RepID=UPI00143E259E|nr:helix-turn-helix domain-containing protein [Hymenobacter sp. BT18]
MQPSIITAGISADELIEQFRAIVRFELQQAGIGPAPAAPAEADELLTVEQAAALFDVGVHTIHDWKRQGKLPFKKMGSRTYFRRGEVLASMQTQQRSQRGGRARG